MTLPKVLRLIGAVIVGFLIVVVLSTGADAVLHASGVYPPESEGFWDPGLITLALAYRCAFTVLAGFVCALLAPPPKMWAVWILAVLGLCGGLAGLITTWSMNFGPHWYPIALAATAIPAVWLGGWLYQRGRPAIA